MRVNEEKHMKIYTLVSTGVDTDRGFFPEPEAKGSFLSLVRARMELTKLIAEEKEELDPRYDGEERSEDHWEAYQNGYAAALFSRIEILTSELSLTPADGDDFCPADYLEQCAKCYADYGTPCCKDEESECGMLDDARDAFERVQDEERMAAAECLKKLGTEFCTCPERTDAPPLNAALYAFDRLVPERWRLYYAGLNSSEKKHLCVIGKCRTCGKALCVGTAVDGRGDELLKQAWEAFVVLCAELSPNLICEHRQMEAVFSTMFHEEDVIAVQKWLKSREETEVTP